MAALIDEIYMRETFQIHKDVGAGRITPYIAIASRKLQVWVGATNYADTTLTEILELAEGSLAMSFITLNLNTNVRPKGMIKVEKVEGDTVIQYLSPTETAQMAAQWFEQAEQIVRDLTGYAPEDGFELVTEEICADSGTTWGKWQT